MRPITNFAGASTTRKAASSKVDAARDVSDVLGVFVFSNPSEAESAVVSPTYVVVGLFALVATVILGGAFLRRGKNLLETLEPLEGETTLVELDAEFCPLLRRRALHTTLVFMAVRVRVTNMRVVVAQAGLLSDKRVLRYVFHLTAQTARQPSEWQDGYYTLVLDAPKSGIETRDGAPVLKLVPADDAPHLPECVFLRGPTIVELAEKANLRTSLEAGTT
jgi:hypothetical protein